MTDVCPETDMNKIISLMEQNDDTTATEIDRCIGIYIDDPRLHFLRGSYLVGKGNLIEAHKSLSKAVEIAPDYLIARFQLGFFQLTSGESNEALKTWARLDGLPDGHYLKSFVIGLRHLIRDEFLDCIGALEKGVSLNVENPPLNTDMDLIIKRCRPLIENGEEEKTEEISSTSAFLDQFSTKH